jgi:hypothetical protein
MAVNRGPRVHVDVLQETSTRSRDAAEPQGKGQRAGPSTREGRVSETADPAGGVAGGPVLSCSTWLLRSRRCEGPRKACPPGAAVRRAFMAAWMTRQGSAAGGSYRRCDAPIRSELVRLPPRRGRTPRPSRGGGARPLPGPRPEPAPRWRPESQPPAGAGGRPPPSSLPRGTRPAAAELPPASHNRGLRSFAGPAEDLHVLRTQELAMDVLPSVASRSPRPSVAADKLLESNQACRFPEVLRPRPPGRE